MKGIYKYTDLKKGEIVYVGKDSHIDRNDRYKAHMRPSRYDDQPFNRILQNNPERYEYDVIWATDDCTTLKLNKMEILFGKIYDPKFNFDKFGKGGCNGHTEETKLKISESLKGENHWNYGNKGQVKHLEPYQFKPGNIPWNTGKKRPEMTREKNPNWKNYGRIIKAGIKPSGKQQYKISYDGVKTLKRSVDKESLKKWFNENYPNVELIDETKEEKQQ